MLREGGGFSRWITVSAGQVFLAGHETRWCMFCKKKRLYEKKEKKSAGVAIVGWHDDHAGNIQVMMWPRRRDGGAGQRMTKERRQKRRNLNSDE